MAGKDFDFKILSFSNAEAMEDEVKAMLRDGWELHGDLKALLQNDTGEVQYIQAMVKDVTPRGRTGFRTSIQD